MSAYLKDSTLSVEIEERVLQFRESRPDLPSKSAVFEHLLPLQRSAGNLARWLLINGIKKCWRGANREKNIR